MKRVVWGNKSNGQLCVTIPKDSGLQIGDVVEVAPSPIKRVAYSFIVGDLFHYGHLQSLQFAKDHCDYNIVGVLTDAVVESYRFEPIANLKERKAVISSLTCVDRVLVQKTLDPTQILKQIHEEFPDAEIVLIKGDNWNHVPGEDYVKSIGGNLLKPPYYPRLSTFKIVNKIVEYKDKVKGVKSFSSFAQQEDLSEFPPDTTIISTKANTLKTLSTLLKASIIEPFFVFTIAEWKNNKKQIIKDIQIKFSDELIVVRSSAINEDTLDSSKAGYFESVLDIEVSDSKSLEKACKQVMHSYKKGNSESSFNQILIQRQTPDIVMSGVLFTRTLGANAPYYVINYDDESGKTDTVTSGKENKVVYVSRFAEAVPPAFTYLIDSVREIEGYFSAFPLDIEFGITSQGKVVIYQVRPLAANINKKINDGPIKSILENLKTNLDAYQQRKDHLAGDTTIFADMPDWNPAEIIGPAPNFLDCSLYQYIITNDAWHEARTQQGYYTVHPAPLVTQFANKPFIDVRSSFNSFVPAQVSLNLREKLVTHYLEKLKKHPELQDKVEFDIAYTCYDLGFHNRSKELLDAGFTSGEVDELRKALLTLTNRLIKESPEQIQADLRQVKDMELNRTKILSTIYDNGTPKTLLNSAKQLLDDCRHSGTVAFSKLARLGFIAKILLKSLVDHNVLDQQAYDSFFTSVSTVASEISEDHRKTSLGQMTEEEFILKYYHLRPGTYDITSHRYDKNPQLLSFHKSSLMQNTSSAKQFTLAKEQAQAVTRAFSTAGLTFTAQEFFDFARAATEGRELAKFEFTKNLSDVLELIAQAGDLLGFTRRELAHLDVSLIFTAAQLNSQQEIISRWQQAISKKKSQRELYNSIILPPVITSPRDIDIVTYYSSKPNFITTQHCNKELVFVSPNHDHTAKLDIDGKIVLIENGDPGYDWIFTRNPAGLITKYGGVASHMAIRCQEFGIPAAIGCGETLFEKIKQRNSCTLNCSKQTIEVH